MRSLRLKTNPEAKIQTALETFLVLRQWFVRPLHGDASNYGWPDLYCCHKQYGQRWIEVKLPEMRGSKFTPAQLEWFPKLSGSGAGIWIMTAADEHEYSVLFRPQNWYHYLSVMK
jgi:hypothetical protein